MKFSTKAEYGLKAMVNLALCYPQQKNIKTISEEEHISIKYLERLMGLLKKAGIVNSTKGKNGGYLLARSPEKINVGHIIEVLDGPIAPMKCAGKICHAIDSCPSSKVWIKLGISIRNTLESINLQSVISQKNE